MLTPQEREFQLGLQFLRQLGPWISLAESPFPLSQCLACYCPTGDCNSPWNYSQCCPFLPFELYILLCRKECQRSCVCWFVGASHQTTGAELPASPTDTSRRTKHIKKVLWKLWDCTSFETNFGLVCDSTRPNLTEPLYIEKSEEYGQKRNCPSSPPF